MWNNLLDYIEIQSKTPVNEELVFMDVLDNILMTEFNCKWVRDKKKNYLKFYSAKELEYFLLRFT